jgi:hypothetical protein
MATTRGPHAHSAEGPCRCERCWKKAQAWRFPPGGAGESWADLYLPPSDTRGMPKPRALCSKADVKHAMDALCDRSTPMAWRLALGRALVNGRLCMDKGERHFEEAGVSVRVEDLFEVSGTSPDRTNYDSMMGPK